MGVVIGLLGVKHIISLIPLLRGLGEVFVKLGRIGMARGILPGAHVAQITAILNFLLKQKLSPSTKVTKEHPQQNFFKLLFNFPAIASDALPQLECHSWGDTTQNCSSGLCMHQTSFYKGKLIYFAHRKYPSSW